MQLYNGMRNNNSCSKAKTRIGHRGKKKKETKESEQARDIVVVMTGVKKRGTNKESETRERGWGI
jgi:hypothetical protein